jgi:hypothetical protein
LHSKYRKNANQSNKKIFSSKIQCGYKKTQNFTLISNPLKKCTQNVQKSAALIRYLITETGFCRRRYWHLAHTGGIFLEGLESAEPWKLANRGLKTGTRFVTKYGFKKEVKNKFFTFVFSWTPAAFSAGSPPAKRIKLENGETFLKTEGEEDNKVAANKNRFLSFDLDQFHSFSP